MTAHKGTRSLLFWSAWVALATIANADEVARKNTLAERIVGTWRLVRYEDRPAEGGATVFPFGEHPVGQLMYDDTGHMSIQLMKIPHPRVASGDDENVSPTEKQALYDAYVGYFGRYRVDEARHVVVHLVEGDLADVYVGHDQERPFRLEGDTLKLLPEWESDGRKWRGVREFVRVR